MMEQSRAATGATAAADLIHYVPLWMKFSDPVWENAFRLYFSALLLKVDVLWCITTFVMTVRFYIKLGAYDPGLYAEHLPDMLQYLAVSAVICYLALYRPSHYVRIRIYLLFASRAHHQLVVLTRLGTDLAPPDGVAFVASSFPLDTTSGIMHRLLATCIYSALVANGYLLIASWHAASAFINLSFPLVKNYRLCTFAVSSTYDTRRQDIHAVFVRWTDSALAKAVPLAAAVNAGEVAAPCAVFRLWALISWGCLAPLLVSNLLEEWARLSFLKAKGCGVLAPGLLWRAVHAIAILTLGSRIVWELLTVLAPLLEWS